MAAKFRADKLFFSSAAVSSDGRIWGGDLFALLHKTMIENSLNSFYLVDHAKYEEPHGNRAWFSFDSVDGVISDFDFPKETKEKYKSTRFIVV